MATISGMAASIRAATDSETFDLAGHDAANITQTITDAFSQPFALDQMIRITFVTGAGKFARQKYDAKASQTVAAALRELDFAEDRGASCVNECAGCYKTQHDTGKNLYTVVVFPRLAEKEEQGAHGGGGGSAPSDRYPVDIPLVEGRQDHTMLVASDETFAEMAPSMCPSWSEKKCCSEILRAAVETMQQMDAKLMMGTALTDDENEFYDGVGGATSIANKGECLKKLMHQQVEDGNLTQRELDKLLQQVQERIDGLNADIDEAVQRSQEKRAAKLSAQKEKAEARRKMLRGHTAKSPHPLKHEAQIAQLRKRLKPLLQLEQSAKGRLLTMKETRELAAKDEMLEEIAELEEASRGWFEDEESFRVRLEAGRMKQSSANSSSKSSSGGKEKKPGTGSRSENAGSTAWLTPGGLASKQAARGRKAKAKKSQPRSGGGAFAARGWRLRSFQTPAAEGSAMKGGPAGSSDGGGGPPAGAHPSTTRRRLAASANLDASPLSSEDDAPPPPPGAVAAAYDTMDAAIKESMAAVQAGDAEVDDRIVAGEPEKLELKGDRCKDNALPTSDGLVDVDADEEIGGSENLERIAGVAPASSRSAAPRRTENVPSSARESGVISVTDAGVAPSSVPTLEATLVQNVEATLIVDEGPNRPSGTVYEATLVPQTSDVPEAVAAAAEERHPWWRRKHRKMGLRLMVVALAVALGVILGTRRDGGNSEPPEAAMQPAAPMEPTKLPAYGNNSAWEAPAETLPPEEEFVEEGSLDDDAPPFFTGEEWAELFPSRTPTAPNEEIPTPTVTDSEIAFPETVLSGCLSTWSLDCDTNEGTVTTTVAFEVDDPDANTYDATVIFHWGTTNTTIGPDAYDVNVEYEKRASHQFDPGEYVVGYEMAWSCEEKYSHHTYRTVWFDGGSCGFGSTPGDS